MQKQMEKNMENELETGLPWGLIGYHPFPAQDKVTQQSWSPTIQSGCHDGLYFDISTLLGYGS